MQREDKGQTNRSGEAGKEGGGMKAGKERGDAYIERRRGAGIKRKLESFNHPASKERMGCIPITFRANPRAMHQALEIKIWPHI